MYVLNLLIFGTLRVLQKIYGVLKYYFTNLALLYQFVFFHSKLNFGIVFMAPLYTVLHPIIILTSISWLKPHQYTCSVSKNYQK